jgi:adenylate cyclase
MIGLLTRLVGLFVYSRNLWVSGWSILCVVFGKCIFLACRYQRQLEYRRQHLLHRHIIRLKSELQELLDGMIPPHFSARAQLEDCIADPHDDVTVLFCSVSQPPSADPLASFHTLDALYSTFDRLLDHHDVVKVEHVGNDYMVVSPLRPRPQPRRPPSPPADLPPAADCAPPEDDERRAGPAADCVALALLARAMVRAGRRALRGTGATLRVGLARGPAVAAVIGRSRRFLRVPYKSV